MTRDQARRDLHEQNRRSWNQATRAHNSHKRDQATFLRAGGSTLAPQELELLGELSGRSLLHLCCNSGQDTLSLARHGARITGVDISDEAIDFATQLATDSGLHAKFERADVYDWLPKAAQERRNFDRVFLSYGAIYWLSDLGALMRGAARVLAPGGRLVLVEFHPLLALFDDEGRLGAPAATGGEPVREDEGVEDYVALHGGAALTPSGWLDGDKGFANPEPAWEFSWSLADVIEAVIGAGLHFEHFREWSFTNGWQPFPGMKDLGQGRFGAAPPLDQLPMMFGLSAARLGSLG
jgi:SAM-dependent methyltransferase